MYPTGASTTGPANLTIHGCANPDGDPGGAWCAVDPEKCPRFAGWVGQDAVNTWAWDYCMDEVKAPAAPSAPAAPAPEPDVQACVKDIPLWGQCGGTSNCSEWGCADQQWAGACCEPGLECRRQDAYWWQCVERHAPVGAFDDGALEHGGDRSSGTAHVDGGSLEEGAASNAGNSSAAAVASGAGGGEGGSNSGAAAGDGTADGAGGDGAVPAGGVRMEEYPRELLEGGVLTDRPLPPPLPEGLGANTSVNATAASLAGLQPKAPGAVVYARLQIGYNFSKLEADVGAQAAFKAKVVTWLKSSAAPDGFIYSAGAREGGARTTARLGTTTGAWHCWLDESSCAWLSP